jgi:hypothetical protein
MQRRALGCIRVTTTLCLAQKSSIRRISALDAILDPCTLNRPANNLNGVYDIVAGAPSIHNLPSVCATPLHQHTLW